MPRPSETGGRPRAVATAPASRLVGRAAELDRLEAALTRVAEGKGGVVLLAGEAGIGKTRLAQTALALARDRGFLTLESRAFPLESSLACAVVIGLLGPHLRRLPPVRREPLVRDLPYLGRLFGGLETSAAEGLGDPSLEKTRLYEDTSQLLGRLAADRPLALLLDDLHWADPASIELFSYFARGIVAHRVLMLVTYRPDEADAARGLRLLVSSVKRAGIGEEVSLPPLDPAAVAALATEMLQSDVPSELLAALDARAAGTPLFVEAIVRGYLESGRLSGTPPDLRDLVSSRLDRLDAFSRSVLDLIAVAGDAIPYKALFAASDVPEAELLQALGRLTASGVVVEEPADPQVVYSLTHPMLQEVAYSALPELTRRRAHARLATAYESLGQDLDRLAVHYRQAGAESDPARSLEVLLAAAERAQSLYANVEAAQHFGAALGLVRQGHRRELLPSLLESLGEAWERVGEGAAAISVWTEALEMSEGRDALAAARLHRQLATAEWDRGNVQVALAHVASGLEALAGSEPSQELADLVHVRLVLAGRLGDQPGRLAAAAELMALAASLQSPRAEAEARLAAAATHEVEGRQDESRDQALKALAAAERGGELALAHRAHATLARSAQVLGDHRILRHHAQLSLEAARHMGVPSFVEYSRFLIFVADLQAGAWEDLDRQSREAALSAHRAGQPGFSFALASRALILMFTGRLAQAKLCLEQARASSGSQPLANRHLGMGADMIEANLALEGGDLERARGLAAALAGGPDLEPFMGLPVLAEAEAAAGNGKAALAAARRLARLAATPDCLAAGNAARGEGLAHEALGKPKQAMRCLTRAARIFSNLEMPFELAQARLDWARCGAGSQPVAAVEAAREALTTFERLGAQRYADRARQQLRRLGVRPPTGRPRRGLLSGRELEVARLAASGLSNAEIAARLFISPRTVSTHLDHVYARLGIGSRGALCQLAGRRNHVDSQAGITAIAYGVARSYHLSSGCGQDEHSA